MQNTLENTSLRCPNPLLLHHGKRWNMYFLSLKINLCNVYMFMPRCTMCIRCSQMSTKVRRGHQMLWNWNYSWNCNRSSGNWTRVLHRAVNELSCWAISPTLSDICFLRKTPWLMTLLSHLLHSSPMCHIVLSVASAPSLHTPPFLFLDPTVLLTHPMTVHMPFPTTQEKNTSQFLHMSCTKLL